MASTPAANPQAAMNADAFVADRVRIWGTFQRFAMTAAGVVALIVILLAVFLG
jgi:hypothetical protein